MQDYVDSFEQEAGAPSTETDTTVVVEDKESDYRKVSQQIQQALYWVGAGTGALLGYGNTKYNHDKGLTGAAVGGALGLAPGFIYGIYRTTPESGKAWFEKGAVAVAIPVAYFWMLWKLRKYMPEPLQNVTRNIEELGPEQAEDTIMSVKDNLLAPLVGRNTYREWPKQVSEEQESYEDSSMSFSLYDKKDLIDALVVFGGVGIVYYMSTKQNEENTV